MFGEAKKELINRLSIFLLKFFKGDTNCEKLENGFKTLLLISFSLFTMFLSIVFTNHELVKYAKDAENAYHSAVSVNRSSEVLIGILKDSSTLQIKRIKELEERNEKLNMTNNELNRKVTILENELKNKDKK